MVELHMPSKNAGRTILIMNYYTIDKNKKWLFDKNRRKMGRKDERGRKKGNAASVRGRPKASPIDDGLYQGESIIFGVV